MEAQSDQYGTSTLYGEVPLERKQTTHCKFRNNVCGVSMCKIVIEFFLKELEHHMARRVQGWTAK